MRVFKPPLDLAIVLAGGLGTRMRPATYGVPKALLALPRSTLLDRAVNEAKAAARGVVVVSGDAVVRARAIALGAAAVDQRKPRGDADALRCAWRLAKPRGFVAVLMVDCVVVDGAEARTSFLTDLAQAAVASKGSIVGVATVGAKEARAYGVVRTKPSDASWDGPIVAVREKPQLRAGIDCAEVAEVMVGAYVFAPDAARYCVAEAKSERGGGGIARGIAAAIKAGEPVYARRVDGAWYDAGSWNGYVAAFRALSEV